MAVSRRSFLKIAGATTALASTSAFANIIVPRVQKPLGVALVGLGYYSTDLLAPALQLTQNCKLTGIVTGSPWKIPVWQEKYGIKDQNVYNYENMHRVADNPDIDVIYIVLPPFMHAEYSIKAADAGKHVWCEKPFAMTERESQAIIDACNKNKRKLSVGYRMQHEPNTQQIIKFGKRKTYGKVQKVEASAGYYESRTDHWKQDWSKGGGAMYDMGVYSLNAARYTTGEEPIAVTARHETTRPEIYDQADETTYFALEFPSGATADCMTTFGRGVNDLNVKCSDGGYGLSPFQSYSGIKGETSDGKKLNQRIPNQQAKQMDDDSRAIMDNTEVIVPGEEGLKDIRVVEAIFKSAKEGKRVEIG